jgi:hypothetical protein
MNSYGCPYSIRDAKELHALKSSVTFQKTPFAIAIAGGNEDERNKPRGVNRGQKGTKKECQKRKVLLF